MVSRNYSAPYNKVSFLELGHSFDGQVKLLDRSKERIPTETGMMWGKRESILLAEILKRKKAMC